MIIGMTTGYEVGILVVAGLMGLCVVVIGICKIMIAYLEKKERDRE